MNALEKVCWYIKGTSVGRKLRHKQRQKIKYLEQLLQDIIISDGSDREELLKEAANYLKNKRY